jgi:hypothetical protein
MENFNLLVILSAIIIIQRKIIYVNASEILSVILHDSVDACGVNIKTSRVNLVQIFEVDLARNFSWTTHNPYTNYDDINYIKDEDLIIENNNKNKAQLFLVNLYFYDISPIFPSEDYISYSSIYKIDQFPLYYIPDIFFHNYDSISLAYSYHNESFSILHYLYTNKIIPHKSFAIKYDEDSTTSGLMYLGGIPNHIVKNYSYYSKCKVNNLSDKWACELTSIQFNGKYYNHTIYPYFQTNSIYILSSSKFIEYIENVFFGKLLDEFICEIVGTWDSKEYQCICDRIPDDLKMSFVLDGIIFTLNKDELFKKSHNMCLFLIKENFLVKDQWVFGSIFYSKYLTYFDQEAGTITFYSNNKFLYERNGLDDITKNVIRKIYIVLIGVLFIWFIILVLFNKNVLGWNK